MDCVLVETIAASHGKQIGCLTLNLPKSLNSLNLEMAQRLYQQLLDWQVDDSIVAVWLQGAGDKAFCAGGDIRAIYQASVDDNSDLVNVSHGFFSQEYQLDLLIHQYVKPVIVWGDGIVMGGGLGLMMGGSHRLVTEQSMIAMPEVSIGLYPDVGGSYFLPRMPAKTGLFLGLTAYRMNAADALYTGVATHAVNRDSHAQILQDLQTFDWLRDDINHGLDQLMSQHASLQPANTLVSHQALINQLMQGSLADIIGRFQQLETELVWLQRAQKSLLKGSPLSWYIAYAQSQLSSELSLAECFQWELNLSINCCVKGDFCEGVRALLVDKDLAPQWQYKQLSAAASTHAKQLMSA